MATLLLEGMEATQDMATERGTAADSVLPRVYPCNCVDASIRSALQCRLQHVT